MLFRSVTTLDLRNNQITDAGVTSLSQALQSPACKLTTLDLVGNRIAYTGEESLRNLKLRKPDLEIIF